MRNRFWVFVAAGLLAASLASCGRPSAGGRPVAPPPIQPGSLVGKWASEGKAGHAAIHSTLEFTSDGKFSGDEEITPEFRRIETGTYTVDGTTLIRKQTSQKLVKKGVEQKVTPTKVRTPLEWRSADEFSFAGAQSTPWKRVK